MVELFHISQRKQQQKYFDHRKVTLCKAGSSRTTGMVLATPVLNNSPPRNLEKQNPLHIELCTIIESPVTGSSSSHFDLPHIPLLLHYLATVCKRAFDKARVVNQSLVSRHLSIRIICTYSSHP